MYGMVEAEYEDISWTKFSVMIHPKALDYSSSDILKGTAHQHMHRLKASYQGLLLRIQNHMW